LATFHPEAEDLAAAVVLEVSPVEAAAPLVVAAQVEAGSYPVTNVATYCYINPANA
jgi:hypothetical protein